MCLKCLLVVAVIFGLVEADDCKTPNGEIAKCISLLDCPLLLKASSDATARNFIDESKCGSGFMVCCGTEANFTMGKQTKENGSETSTSQPVKQSQSNKTTIGFMTHNSSRSNLTREEKIKLLPSKKICGYQHSDDYFHTVNYTVLSEFPWLAVIATEAPPNPHAEPRPMRAWSQTGTLLNRKYVLTVQTFATLTAAIVPIEITGVWLGGYHPLNETECLEDANVYECNNPPQYFQIDKVIYPKYNSTLTLLRRSIALLRLQGTVDYSDYIRPICLPLPGTRRPMNGDRVVESSSEIWELGHSRSFGNGTKTRYYLEFQNKCDDYYVNNLDAICLPYIDANLTSEPIGGPLMYSYRLQWYQEAIAVFRWNDDPIKGVYINVSYHIDWILDNLEP